MKWLTEDGMWRTRYIPGKEEVLLEHYEGEGNWVFRKKYRIPLSWPYYPYAYGAEILIRRIGAHPDSLVRIEEENDREWEKEACRKPEYWP